MGGVILSLPPRDATDRANCSHAHEGLLGKDAMEAPTNLQDGLQGPGCGPCSRRIEAIFVPNFMLPKP